MSSPYSRSVPPPNPAYYIPSGLSGPSGVSRLRLCAAGFTAVAAVLYGFGSCYLALPIVQIPFFFLCLGIAAFGVVYGGILGHVRQPRAYQETAVICGFFFLYLHWIVFLAVQKSALDPALSFPSAFASLLLAPGQGWDMAEKAAVDGRWATKLSALRSIFLWAAWELEIIVAVLGIIILGTRRDAYPYSEADGRWMTREILPARLLTVDDPAALREVLEEGDFTPLCDIPRSDDARRYSLLTVFQSPGDEMAYLSLHNVSRGFFGREKKTAVFERLKVPAGKGREVVERLRDIER